jgi:hypothetical protein
VIRAQIAVLAQRAEAREDGLIDAYGIGIDAAWAAQFPATIEFTVVLRLEFDRPDAEQLHEIRVLFDHEGVTPFPSLPPMPVKALNVNEVGRTAVNVMIPCRIGVMAPGRLTISVMVDEVRVPALHLDVRSVPSL